MSKTGRQGQASIETLLLIGLVVTALVGLTVYLQRAYQGYLYANSAGQGPQFDPTQPSTDTKTLDHFTSTQLITVKVAAPSYALPGGACPTEEDCLPDRPAATVVGRAMLRTTTKSQTDFAVSRSATFDAQ